MLRVGGESLYTEWMEEAGLVLTGKLVRLEPLGWGHIEGLAAASASGDAELYRWSAVPLGRAAVEKYVGTALAWRDAGTAVPFAIVRVGDGVVIGSTRFWNLERWAWPEGHARWSESTFDGCEIGYTWLAPDAIRTGANTEAKLLMLTQAFEGWGMLRVCLCTDVRNQRSAAAIARIGGKLEGTLRAHRLAADLRARDTLRFSILAEEWAQVKARLVARLG